MNFAFTAVSRNEKTGPMPVTSSNRDTCPPSCPLAGDGGCYGEYGRTGMHWAKIDNGERGHDWDLFLDHIRTIRPGRLWRHNVVGDLPGVRDRINGRKLGQLVKANKGRRGFTFSHYPVIGPNGGHNLKQIEKANAGGFTVNLSFNTIRDAVAWRLAGNKAPAVAIAPLGYFAKLGASSVTIDGVKVVQCPAESEGMQCIDCGICQRSGRAQVVAFTAHGTKKKQADIIAREWSSDITE